MLLNSARSSQASAADGIFGLDQTMNSFGSVARGSPNHESPKRQSVILSGNESV